MHGRGVTRSEALRAVPVFHELGFTSLLISYRNDGEAPASDDGRYSLGDAEWRDLEAAVRFAREQRAQRILVMGWSMGGASTLQFVTRSELSSAVEGIILESPVVDWIRVLHAQAAQQQIGRDQQQCRFHQGEHADDQRHVPPESKGEYLD